MIYRVRFQPLEIRLIPSEKEFAFFCTALGFGLFLGVLLVEEPIVPYASDSFHIGFGE